MGRRDPVLAAKLQPPKVKTHYLFRSRLHDLFKRVKEYPLTLVQAEAGYGKSTAMAVHLSRLYQYLAWYTVEEGERDTFLFLTYLIHSLKTIHPGIGERSLRLLEEADSVSSVLRPCVVMLLNDVAELAPDPTVLVLDDLHAAVVSQEIGHIVEMVIRYLPPHVHLVAGTRKELNLPIVRKLQSTFDVLSVGKVDLAFTKDEIAQLFNRSYGIHLTAAQLKELEEQTEGWIMALQMVWKGLEKGLDLADVWKTTGETDKGLFPYLAEEVLNRQPEELRKFLECTCILQTMEPEVCNLLAGCDNADKVLAQLENEGLFVSAISSGTYRYHRLFQQFLISYLIANRGHEAWRALHRTACIYYLRKGEVLPALQHGFDAGDLDKVTNLLIDYGEQFLTEGRLEVLKGWIERVPTDMLSRHPKLLFWRGEIDRLSCRFSEADHWYRLAEGGFIRQGDVRGRSLVYRGQAQLYLDTIQPAKATVWLEKAVEILGTGEPEETAKVLRLLAENYTNSGQVREARQMLRRAKQLAPSGRNELDIRILLRSGRLSAAKRLILRMIEEERGKASGTWRRVAKSHREQHLLLSLIDAFMGEVESSKASAEEGIRIGRDLQSPFVELVGFMRLGHALGLAGRLHEAKECYRNSIEMSEQLKVERGKVEALMGLCIVSGLLGELEEADRYGRQGLELASAVHDRWCANMIRLSLGLVWTTWRQYDEALSWLLEAEKGFTECGDRFCLTSVWLWLAILYEKTGNDKDWERVAVLLLRSVKRNRYEFLFLKRTLFGPYDLQMIVPTLIKVKDRLRLENAAEWLSCLGWRGESRHPGYTLRIFTLGKFAVYRGIEEIGRREWKREKARQLFQLLVTRSGQYLHREEICDLLWPSADEATARRDFKVALNALMAAIEPDREARTESYFIERMDTAYRLDPRAAVWIDRDQFEKKANYGLALAEKEWRERGKVSDGTLAMLEEAVSLYRGDYLQDYPYQEWCADERERLAALYLRVLDAVARIRLAAGEIQEAIAFCERILAKDPCWESAYRTLMVAYHRLGNRSLVMSTYQRCATQLEEQLGLAPMEETTRLYQQLMQKSRNDNLASVERSVRDGISRDREHRGVPSSTV